MISIDKLAYISELRKVNPIEKFIFAIVTMFLCIICNNIKVSIIVFMLMSLITVFKGKTTLNIYLKLILVPLAFLIIGTITIAINIGENNDFLLSTRILNVNLGLTKESILLSIGVLFKALSAVSCLYFLSLSTPIVELLSVLRKLKVPKLFIELMSLIYRFIFILLETVNMIYISQNSRLGYSNIKSSYNSLGKLITSLFISSYKRSEDMYIALESRCYDGEINVIENVYKLSYRNLFLIGIVEIVLILISIY